MVIRIGGLDMNACGLPLKDDGRGDWIRTSDLHTPSVMRYQAALRPDLAGASRQGNRLRQGVRGSAWVGVGEKQQRPSGLGAAQSRCWPYPSPISSPRRSEERRVGKE